MTSGYTVALAGGAGLVALVALDCNGVAGNSAYYGTALPVPLMNLMIRAIDRWAVAPPLVALDPSRIGRTLSPGQRNVAYTSLWAGAFIALSAVQGVGDRHPGQFLPFWQDACRAGSPRACR